MGVWHPPPLYARALFTTLLHEIFTTLKFREFGMAIFRDFVDMTVKIG